jgi:transcriptional regulator with XRE-family HTH domain
MVAQRPFPAGFPAHPTTLGEYLQHERMKRGISQERLATMLQVRQKAIGFWERNVQKIEMHHIPRIIEFLGFTPPMLKNFQPMKCNVFLYRCEHNISQRAMAERLNMSVDTLRAIEWNTHPQTEETLKKIEAFGL